jgi:uncharacterized protein (DUF362 family)/NAD-dependent dihydropyrimidine dehydrogenase PreA subunit
MPIKNKTSNNSVCIQKYTYSNLDVESLISPLGGFKKYIKKGDQVLLKTNLLNASEPNKSIVTNPIVVGEVAKAILKAGGTPYIGDSPSGQFTKRRLEKVYIKSGLKKLAESLGIKLNYDTKTKKIDIPNGKRLTKTTICRFFLDADKTIALPKIKTHSLMMMTLATKIMYGVIPGLTKVRYHSKFIRRKSFAEMLMDVLSVTKPDLIIMDGIIGMQGDGPAGGIPVDLGIMLASENAVAIDLSVCKILNIEPIGVPTLREAKIRKMWPKKINYPLLTPIDVNYNKFILPATAGHILTGEKTPVKYPIVTNKCTACGLCTEICPKKAISNKENTAILDYSKCIKCYCCHEICPYGAIKLDTINQ